MYNQDNFKPVNSELVIISETLQIQSIKAKYQHD